MKQLLRYTCLLLLNFFFYGIEAKNEQFIRFTNISPNGTQAICSFAQDSTGLIWLGTGNGLYSYDGYRTIPYYNTTSGNHPRIHTILQADDATLYLGTDNGLQIFHIQSNRFETTTDNGPQDIRTLLKDGNTLWTGGIDGLYTYDLQKKRFKKSKAIRQPVYALLQTPDGILAGTYEGLFFLKNGHITEIPLVKENQPFVNSLLWDNNRKCVWIGTDMGLFQYIPSNSTFKFIPGFSRLTIKALTINREGELWIGTDTGLYLYMQDGKTSVFTHSSQNPHSLTNNIVWNLFTDKWQNVWIGTDNGISLVERSSYARFIPISEITGGSEGNNFHAMLEDSHGYLWAGGTNGLIRTKEENGIFKETAWFKPGSALHPLSHNRIRQIYEDREGGLWVTTDGGLNYYDYQTGQFRHFLVTDRTKRYNCNWAYDIVEDEKGRMWIAAYMGGIFIIDRKRLISSDGKCVADIHIDNSKGSLPDIHVNRLAQDKNGNIWAFQYNNFLAWINYETLEVKSLRIPQGRHISNIIAGEDGSVWVRCEQSVLRYSSPNQTPQEYWLFNDNSHTVENFCDVNGTLWAFSGQDIRILNSRILNLHLNRPVGTITSACYLPEKKKVMLGVNDGLWELTLPEDLRQSKDFPLLQLSSIEVNGQPLSPQGTGTYNLSSLTLKNYENNLTFNFTDLPYKDSPSSPFLYCMEGVSSSVHSFSSDDKHLSFNGLPHGSYTLKIYMEDSGGQLGKMVYSIDIKILPPWYLSIPAKLCYLLIIGGLIIWAINFYLVRKRLKMEQLARRRITEQSQAKLAFYSHLSHELKSPLSHLMGTLSHMLSGTKDADAKQKLEAIQHNSTQLNRLIHRALDVNKDDSGEKELFLSYSDITGICRQIADSFKHEAGKKQISVLFESNVETLYTDIDLIKWETILNNLLTNAVQYTLSGGKIIIRLNVDDSQRLFSIEVADTGIGITPEESPYIFQRFYQGYRRNQQSESTGLGLYIVRQYTELMHGTVTFTSTPGEGSTFMLKFPLNDILEKNSGSEVPNDASISPAGYDERLFAKITVCTEEHLSDPTFNVRMLSELTNVSEKTITRKLKQFTGQTAVEYIRGIRMKKASMYLSQGKFSVTEVMYMVGFSNTGYFSKCFQRSFGCTPKEYVRKTSDTH